MLARESPDHCWLLSFPSHAISPILPRATGRKAHRAQLNVLGSPSQRSNSSDAVRKAVRKPSHLRLFWHGIIDGTTSQVTLSKDQGSNKVRPLLSANCWVVAPKGPEQISHGTWADCYSSLSSSIGGDTPKRDSTDQNSSSEPLRSAAGPCWIVASMKWLALPQWIP